MCGWKAAHEASHALYEPFLLSESCTTRKEVADDDQIPTHTYKVTKFSDF